MEALKENLILLYSTPVYVIAIGLELLFSHFTIKFSKNYTIRETLANVYLNLVNFAVDFLCRIFYLGILLWIFHHFPVRWPNFGWLYWICLLISVDFVFYWLHRFDHEIRFFWAVHVTHHSSTEFNFTTGFRSSVLEPFYRFVYFIPLILFGFQPLDILFMFSLTQIWGTFVHTRFIKNMGWLELVFVTPSHHRVHHASNAKYLDKNMGMFLIIWDKFFGTFQKELPENEYEPIRFGLTHPLEKQNGFQLIFHEWIQILKDISPRNMSLKEKFRYIFGKPGYSHDGSRKTSAELREEEKKKQQR